MEKLIALVNRLKDEIVPDSPIGKMSKEQLLAFYRDKSILDRARIFHQKLKKYDINAKSFAKKK